MQTGKTYLVNSSRKGTFIGRLDRLDDTWATLTITAGKARALLDYNEREKGEEVTVRRSLCTFTEQPTTKPTSANPAVEPASAQGEKP